MFYEIIPYDDISKSLQSFAYRNSNPPDFEGFKAFMHEKYPWVMMRKALRCSKEELTDEFREDCWKFRFIVRPISTFVETTFTADEMAALKVVVDHAAINCGAGEDTIGAIMYTGAFHKLQKGDGAVCNLARKIDCYGD